MKIKNPKFIDPVTAFVESKKAAVDAFFTTRVAEAHIDFDDVRAAFPNVVDPLTGNKPMTDGTIHEICEALGVEVTT